MLATVAANDRLGAEASSCVVFIDALVACQEPSSAGAMDVEDLV